jgi:hypothetical protein
VIGVEIARLMNRETASLVKRGARVGRDNAEKRDSCGDFWPVSHRSPARPFPNLGSSMV